MLRSLSFAKKILLAAALVVVFAFTCFILYNDTDSARPCARTRKTTSGKSAP